MFCLGFIMRYAYLDTSKNCAQNVADLKIKLDI
ncbi:hypothetical protein ACIN8IBEIGE_50412 [Acinetobacter sp. 8I-beige]|nr:hypothetical protein ACIN8IBEIGE_50412 [Acinetobacter sp. 8I-beige]